MEKLIDIIDNGRRIVSVKYTDEELAQIRARIQKKMNDLQLKYDIENDNTLPDTGDAQLDSSTSNQPTDNGQEQPTDSVETPQIEDPIDPPEED